jgi:hypothetical protein
MLEAKFLNCSSSSLTTHKLYLAIINVPENRKCMKAADVQISEKYSDTCSSL